MESVFREPMRTKTSPFHSTTVLLSLTIPEPAAEYNKLRTRAGSSVKIKSAMDLDPNKEE